MNRFSPSEAALEGFRLTRERPRAILAWSGVYFVGMAAIALLMTVILGPKFIELTRKGGLAGDPDAMANLLSHSAPAFLLLLAMAVALMSILTAAIYRIILRPQEKSFAYLRLGPDELRLTGVNLLLFGVGMVCLFLGILMVKLAARVGPLPEAVAVAVVFLLTVWIGVRLSMVTPMTFALRRISLRSAWVLSRSEFWPLLGMIVLAVIFYVMVWMLISIIGLAIVTVAGGPAAVADVTHMAPTTLLAWIATVFMQLILYVLQVVMIYAPFGVAYEQLHGDVSVDPLRPVHKPIAD
jgi:hypothetical protein